MVFLYVISAEAATGKTMLGAGLGKYLQDSGKKVGFLKPVAGGGLDDDAVFMSRVLGLGETSDFICPPAGSTGKVMEACAAVSREKDIVLIESVLGQDPADNYEVAKKLEARVIIVQGYSKEPGRFLDRYRGFGKNLAGVIINKVPASRLERVREESAVLFGGAGLKLLGIVPEDRRLGTLTVGELAACLQGKILNNDEKSGELIENFMLGAMVVGSGLDYFGRKNNKAAIVRSDRPDMQLAAVETSTRCLVVSGAKEPPIYGVRNKAASHGIPVVITENSTPGIVAKIEGCLGQARFHQESVLAGLADFMRPHLDFPAMARSLGLAG